MSNPKHHAPRKVRRRGAPAVRGVGPVQRPEDRLATHDGYIWPLDRADMVTARAIRARMAEDAGELIAAQGSDGCVTQADFRRAGWSHEQIRAHGVAAVTLALETEAA